MATWREQRRRRGCRTDSELPKRDHWFVGRRGACAVPERLRLLDPAALRVGARKKDHVTGTGGAAADLRIGLDFRPLRPRPAAPRHGRRHRDLRSRHREAAAARGTARLPDRRQAHQGAGPGNHGNRRKRRGPDGRRQAHRGPPRPGPPQHLLPNPPGLVRKTLTHIAALDTLSRGAGEGLQQVDYKLLSRTAGEGGPSPKGLGGEGMLEIPHVGDYGWPRQDEYEVRLKHAR